MSHDEQPMAISFESQTPVHSAAPLVVGEGDPGSTIALNPKTCVPEPVGLPLTRGEVGEVAASWSNRSTASRLVEPVSVHPPVGGGTVTVTTTRVPDDRVDGRGSDPLSDTPPTVPDPATVTVKVPLYPTTLSMLPCMS
jgi:hypothetical protein